MKIISYSLWGNDPRYIEPLLQNITQTQQLYSGWEIVIFVGESTHRDTVQKLKDLNITVFYPYGNSPDSRGMFWRHRAVLIEGAEVILFRDSDSLLTKRDKEIVDFWIKSNKDFYAIRDHINHNKPIIGCSWGVKGEGIKKLSHIGKYDPIQATYGDDESYIAHSVYLPFRKEFMIFSPFNRYRGEKPTPIPIKRNSYQDYIGRIHDDSKETLRNDEALKKVLENKKFKPTYKFFIPYSLTWSIAHFFAECILRKKGLTKWRKFPSIKRQNTDFSAQKIKL